MVGLTAEADKIRDAVERLRIWVRTLPDDVRRQAATAYARTDLDEIVDAIDRIDADQGNRH